MRETCDKADRLLMRRNANNPDGTTTLSLCERNLLKRNPDTLCADRDIRRCLPSTSHIGRCEGAT